MDRIVPIEGTTAPRSRSCSSRAISCGCRASGTTRRARRRWTGATAPAMRCAWASSTWPHR